MKFGIISSNFPVDVSTPVLSSVLFACLLRHTPRSLLRPSLGPSPVEQPLCGVTSPRFHPLVNLRACVIRQTFTDFITQSRSESGSGVRRHRDYFISIRRAVQNFRRRSRP